jgi:hypothetical protein
MVGAAQRCAVAFPSAVESHACLAVRYGIRGHVSGAPVHHRRTGRRLT